MRKPANVTQEAWDAAEYTHKMSDALAAIGHARTPIEMTAHAIQAAKLEAYQEAAKVAEERHRVWGTNSQTEGIEVEDDISACLEIATAILALGDAG